MNAERAQAYGRVMRKIEDLGPAKLLPEERERLRVAADTLLFCDAPECADDARAALVEVERLAGHLVTSGRWQAETADELVDDVSACGAVALVA